MAVPQLPDEIWQEYARTRSPRVQEHIITNYQPLVLYVVRMVAQNMPHYVDRDDLISCGNLGLLDAVDRYDLSRNIRFQTYAMTRIRGAIVDGLRSADWVPRSVRAQVKAIDRTTADLESRLGRPASLEELSEATGHTTGELSRLSQETTAGNFVPLETQLMGENGTPVPLSDLVPDERIDAPESSAMLDEVKRQAAVAITHLAEHLRIVLVLHHYEGLSIAAISEILGVTESRVCQIHYAAVLAMARCPI